MSNRTVRQSAVPPNELNEWGHPNHLWEFQGYDEKHACAMWKRIDEATRRRSNCEDLIRLLKKSRCFFIWERVNIMGTRNLTIIVEDNKHKVAQYCQWDGYPEGREVELAIIY